MKIRFLGAHNTQSRTTHLMSILVDDVLALDAGSLASRLSFRAQTKIKNLLITHSHYDHIRDVPAFAMNLFLRGKTVNIVCSQPVREVLLSALMNGEIYPDFTRRPVDRPTIRFTPADPDETIHLDGYLVKPVPMRHALPDVGYEITSGDGKRVFYTGDTGPELSEAWRKINPDMLIIEVTASNRYESFVKESLHMTPGLLEKELTRFREIRGYLPRVAAVHMNPELEGEIREEIAGVANTLGAEIILAHEGMILRL